MNIFIEPEEIEKLADLILALRTKMDEHNIKGINIKTGKVNYNEPYNKPGNEKEREWKYKSAPLFNVNSNTVSHLDVHRCETCAYESLRISEPPCYSCGIEEGRYDNWKERTEIE